MFIFCNPFAFSDIEFEFGDGLTDFRFDEFLTEEVEGESGEDWNSADGKEGEEGEWSMEGTKVGEEGTGREGVEIGGGITSAVSFEVRGKDEL